MHPATIKSSLPLNGSVRAGAMWHCFQRIGFLLTILGLFVMGSGCRSVTKRLHEQEAIVRGEWSEDVKRIRNLEDRTVNWEQAVELLELQNLEMKRSRVDITNAHAWVRQVYRDLIPNLNLRSGVSKRVRNFSTLSADDVTFSADGVLNVPGIVNFGTRLYAAKLAEIRAETNFALQRRKQVIELFKAFQDYTRLRSSETTLMALRDLALALSADTAGGVQSQEIRLVDDAILTVSRGRDELNHRIGNLLGDATRKWILEPENLPQLDYSDFDLTEDSPVGKLQSRFVAIELEGGRARISGIKLRYWPELYFSVTGPPIYRQSVGGVGQFWDPEDIRVSADLVWMVDTRGQNRTLLRQSERSLDLQRQQLRNQSQTQIAKLLAAKRALRDLDQELVRMDAEAILRKEMGSLLQFHSASDIVQAARSEWELRQRFESQRIELESLFWFVDDSRWEPLPGEQAESTPSGTPASCDREP